MNKRSIIFGVMLSTLLFTASCSNKKSDLTTITISITPWVGFYPLYFAIEKGISIDNGVDLRIVETMTAADFTRANVKEHIDAFASSTMELLKANKLLQEPLTIAFFVDYSNGADVIVARNDIKTLPDLLGKKVGFEKNSLEHLFLNLALKTADLTQDDIEGINVAQVSALEMFNEDKVDAYSTFPPISNSLVAQETLHVLFDSSQIPYMILDMVTLKSSRIHKLAPLQRVWYEVTDYISHNPQEYIQFLSKVMNVQLSSAQSDFDGIHVIGQLEQSNITLARILKITDEACAILNNEFADCKDGLHKIYLDGKPLTDLVH